MTHCDEQVAHIRLALTEKLKNKEISHNSTLTKKSPIIGDLKLIKSMVFFTSSNEISFRF